MISRPRTTDASSYPKVENHMPFKRKITTPEAPKRSTRKISNARRKVARGSDTVPRKRRSLPR